MRTYTIVIKAGTFADVIYALGRIRYLLECGYTTFNHPKLSLTIERDDVTKEPKQNDTGSNSSGISQAM